MLRERVRSTARAAHALRRKGASHRRKASSKQTQSARSVVQRHRSVRPPPSAVTAWAARQRIAAMGWPSLAHTSPATNVASSNGTAKRASHGSVPNFGRQLFTCIRQKPFEALRNCAGTDVRRQPRGECQPGITAKTIRGAPERCDYVLDKGCPVGMKISAQAPASRPMRRCLNWRVRRRAWWPSAAQVRQRIAHSRRRPTPLFQVSSSARILSASVAAVASTTARTNPRRSAGEFARLARSISVRTGQRRPD